jgi:phage I-like protein
MSKHTATTFLISCLAAPAMGVADSMTGLTVLDAFVADPAAAAANRGPEWIMVAPRGKFTARDGRQFDVDPELLAARFVQDGIDLPVDVDHATVKKAMFGDNAPAVGWISKLEARATGLFGKVEWLEEGLRVLTARTHRYISPVLKHDEQGRAFWLHSAALVAAPAASMPAVASADLTSTPEPKMLKAIAVALGLTEDAAENSCLSAISSLKSRIDPAVHQEALNKVASLSADLETRTKADHQSKVDALLEGALKEKKISPAQREQYAALCATADGLTSVTALLGVTTSALAASTLDGKTPANQLSTLSAEDRDVMRQMGLSEDDYRKANGLIAA